MSRTKFKKGDVVQYTGESLHGCEPTHKGKLGVVCAFDEDRYVRVNFFNWCDGREYNGGKGWGCHPENLELVCHTED